MARTKNMFTKGSLVGSTAGVAMAGALLLAPSAMAGSNPVTSVDSLAMSAKYQVVSPSGGYSSQAACEAALPIINWSDPASMVVSATLANTNNGWDSVCFKLPSGKYSFGKVGYTVRTGAATPKWLSALKPVAAGPIAGAKMHNSATYPSIDACVATKNGVIASIQSHGGSMISSNSCVYVQSKDTYTYGGLSYTNSNGFKISSNDAAISKTPYVGVFYGYASN